jgi:hypothetical protein
MRTKGLANPAGSCGLDLALMAIVLSSTTRYLDLWTFNFRIDQADVREYAFSSAVPRKVKPWAGMVVSQFEFGCVDSTLHDASVKLAPCCQPKM